MGKTHFRIKLNSISSCAKRPFLVLSNDLSKKCRIIGPYIHPSGFFGGEVEIFQNAYSHAQGGAG